MRAFFKHPARVTGRFFWFVGEVTLALLDFIINVIFRGKVTLVRSRAQWLQQSCRRDLRILNVKIHTQCSIPFKGLLVCNHLGFLYILVISTITPTVFISKSEVKRWPIFGWFAQLSATLFVNRTRRSDVARLNQEVAHVLDA